MMNYNMTHKDSPTRPARVTPALRDGLIAIAGLTIAAGSLLNAEITMWFLGA